MELEKEKLWEEGKKERRRVHLPSRSVAICRATWAQERGQTCIPFFLGDVPIPCNLTLPVINYLLFTVDEHKAPIASLWAIKASMGWYQASLTSCNLSCHCHLLKGPLCLVPRVPQLFMPHTWAIVLQYTEGQGSAGLEGTEQCLQLLTLNVLCSIFCITLTAWEDHCLLEEIIVIPADGRSSLSIICGSFTPCSQVEGNLFFMRKLKCQIQLVQVREDCNVCINLAPWRV